MKVWAFSFLITKPFFNALILKFPTWAKPRAEYYLHLAYLDYTNKETVIYLAQKNIETQDLPNFLLKKVDTYREVLGEDTSIKKRTNG